MTDEGNHSNSLIYQRLKNVKERSYIKLTIQLLSGAFKLIRL